MSGMYDDPPREAEKVAREQAEQLRVAFLLGVMAGVGSALLWLAGRGRRR